MRTIYYDLRDTKGQQKEIEDRLINILVKVGAWTIEEEEEPSTFFTDLSLWLFDNYGANGYSEMPFLTVNIIINTVISFIDDYVLAPIFSIF